jgi:type II secretory pathway pseudopilin PulG
MGLWHSMKKKRLISLTVILLLLASLSYSRLSSFKDRSRIKLAIVEMATMKSAIEGYRDTLGEVPMGNNASILQLLSGGNSDGRNPTKIVFLSFGENKTNESGEFLDPWRTPYQIQILGTNDIKLKSAGKNRAFGDKDDLVWPE